MDGQLVPVCCPEDSSSDLILLVKPWRQDVAGLRAEVQRLRRENLEIVEVQIDRDSPSAGKRVENLELPDGARLISVMRSGRAEIAVGATQLEAGDQVLAILEPGKEDELRRVLLRR